MRLEGIHHVTAITGDAPGNVDFYVRVLGLRLVKKTVNQDDPTVYHLFYADEKGSRGLRHHLLRVPRARRGRAGAGMVHRVVWRVASEAALDFWEERLARRGRLRRAERGPAALRRPRGLGLELAVVETGRRAAVAEHPEIPTEHGSRASTAFAPTRATRRRAASSSRTRSGSSAGDGGYEARGEQRGGIYGYDPAPTERGIPGAGHRAPRRVGVPARRSTRPGGSACTRRAAADARHRPLLLQVDLLPRAERRPVRDRDARPRLHGRRAARDARRAPVSAARTSSTCASRSSRC